MEDENERLKVIIYLFWFIYFILHVWVFYLCIGVYNTHTHTHTWFQWVLEGGIRYLESRVTDGSEPPWECWVLGTHPTSSLNYQLAKSQNDNFKIEGTREMVKNMDFSWSHSLKTACTSSSRDSDSCVILCKIAPTSKCQPSPTYTL